MAQRDDLFRKFGPLLLEALIMAIIEEQNEHRRARGWPDITVQEVVDRMENHITELVPYDWMEEEP